MSQLATTVSKLEGAKGKLPSQMEINPRENASAVMLRSRKVLEPATPSQNRAQDKTDENETRKEKSTDGTKEDNINTPIQKIVIPPTFPEEAEQGRKNKCGGECIGRYPKEIVTEVQGSGALNLGPLKDTRIIIQLAHRSNSYPEGMIQDVLIKDEVDWAIQQSKDDYDAQWENDGRAKDSIRPLKSLIDVSGRFENSVLPLPTTTDRILPSIVRAPKLELKKLPENLKYVYLGEEETLPIIITKELTRVQEEQLI
ncbi:hypothetical protein CRG98_010521 [Punica granatum]|uniref:Uncharacterized protein n=1 Tax=Punica granatum TaxID=22663 RepID=A0A2I0KKM1_PUNGR|nr:hypothetical protein CRG98_010521 [Punica granatum]